MSTINVGQFNLMRVDRKVDFGFYMDDGAEGILLPKRFVPAGLQIDDTISVFVYHDSDNRLIEKELGWSPAWTLSAGLSETYAWINDQVRVLV